MLDPVCPDDPPLLWFDEDGRAVPNPRLCQNEQSFVCKRTRISIELYHLNHVETVERRKVLASEIKDIAEKADYYFAKYEGGDMTAKNSFADRIGELRHRLKPETEYSAAAHATLMGLRGTSAIAETVLAQC